MSKRLWRGLGVIGLFGALAGCGALREIWDEIPTPRPTQSPTQSPTQEPSQEPTPVPTLAPQPQPTNTPVPVPVPTSKPCNAPPPAPLQAVTLAYVGSCPRGFEKITQYDAQRFAPQGMLLCSALSSCLEDGNRVCEGWLPGQWLSKAAWRFGHDLSAGHWVMKQIGAKWLAYDGGRGCVDAYGRHFPESQGCERLYEHPEGPLAPWGFTGIALPQTCPEEPTPSPVPPGPTPTPNLSCAPVEQLAHFMAPGDRCHVWHQDLGRIKCLVDSTIRPICDFSHRENWDSFCGQREHDPDYGSPVGEQVWRISGASDEGPHKTNYAQRWILGAPGAQVSVQVCIRPDAQTPDGCKITRRGDGCGERTFRLPVP